MKAVLSAAIALAALLAVVFTLAPRREISTTIEIAAPRPGSGPCWPIRGITPHGTRTCA